MAAPDSSKRRVVAKKAIAKPAIASDRRPSTDLRDSVWHRVGRYALYATAAVLPWLVIPATGTAADGAKTVFAALAATVGLVALLADTIERRRLAYPGSLASLGVLAVVVTTALSALLSVSTSMSFFGGLVMPDSLVHVVIAALMFVLAATFITEQHEAEKLLAAFLWGSGVAMILSILGMLGVPYFSSVLVTGSLSSLGFLAVLSMGLSTIMPWDKLRTHGRVLVVKTAVLGVVTLALVNYTELWIALALVALLTASLAFMRKATIRLPLIFAVIALALTLVGPHLPALGMPGAEVRPNLTASADPIEQTLSSSRAVLGTGPATYPYAFAAARDEEFNLSPFWNTRFDQAMSFALTLPVTGGIVGVLAWLFLAFGALELARRRLGSPVTMAAGLAVALTALLLLAFPASFSQLVAGGIALGILVGWSGYRRTMPFTGPANGRLLATFALLVIVAAGSLAGLYVTAQKFTASLYGGAAGRAAAAGDVDLAVARLAKAVSLDDSDFNLRLLSQGYLAQFQQLSAEDAEAAGEQLQGAVSLSLQAARAAIESNPADAQNYGNLGAIYEGLTAISEGADQEALGAYSQAAEREPGNPEWKLASARVYAALAEFQRRAGQPVGDSYAKAQESLTAALALKENYLEARFVSARYFLADGKVSEAEEQARIVLASAPNDPEIALQVGLVFYEANQLPFSQAAFSRAVSLNPEYANARYFLGLALSRQGQNDAALAQFRAIAETNPESQEIRTIIGNIEAGRPVLEGLVDQAPAGASSSTDAVVPAGDLPQQ